MKKAIVFLANGFEEMEALVLSIFCVVAESKLQLFPSRPIL